MPFVRQNATVITVFTGGNDVNTITSALGNGAGGSDQTGFIDGQVKAFGADYATLLNGIRGRAGSARIILLNLPNLGALPFLSGASLAQREAAQRASVGMTKVVNTLVSSTLTVIDLMCDPRSYNSANTSSDGFHPNDAGYAFIAGEVVKAVTSSAYPAPQSSCSFMTTVP
jgi:lysophospholipase L1-like esterase